MYLWLIPKHYSGAEASFTGAFKPSLHFSHQFVEDRIGSTSIYPRNGEYRFEHNYLVTASLLMPFLLSSSVLVCDRVTRKSNGSFVVFGL